MELRTCNSCGIQKTIDEYYNSLAGRTELRKGPNQRRYRDRVCKQCKQKQQSERISSSPEQFIRKRHNQLAYARRKKGGEQLTITVQDLIDLYYKQDGKCAISGMKMDHSTDRVKAKRNSNKISIDRIVPDGPYEIGNIQLVCTVVNFMKGTIDNDDFIVFCKKIASHNA